MGRLPTLNGLREVMDRNVFAVKQIDLQRLAAESDRAAMHLRACIGVAAGYSAVHVPIRDD